MTNVCKDCGIETDWLCEHLRCSDCSIQLGGHGEGGVCK